MESSHHIRHYHRHFGASYAFSLRQRLYSFVAIPILVVLVIFFIQTRFTNFSYTAVSQLTLVSVVGALFSSLARLFVAYAISLALSIPMSLLVTRNATAERLLLPTFDILQSVPILAFFPIVIAFFLHFNFTNGAAVFVLVISMVWSLVFSLAGGLREIPSDIHAAAQVFGLRGWGLARKVLLPASVPYLITGSLLAWAEGWNILIVAEVLHTYIPGGTSSQDLFGIGSVLVNAAASGHQQTFLLAIVVMVIAIGLMNFFIWQKLLHYAERFKFE